MQSLEMSSSEGTTQTLGNTGAPVTTGWLLRRMALWFLFVALGVAGSCLLYMAASPGEPEYYARTPGSTPHGRAVKG